MTLPAEVAAREGEGELDLAAVLMVVEALRQMHGYHVVRHDHDAEDAAEAAAAEQVSRALAEGRRKAGIP